MRTLAYRVALLCALLAPMTAPAQSSGSPRRKGGQPTLALEEVAIMLSSQDQEELRSALESAALLSVREVLPLLEERVRSGLPFPLLEVAIDSVVLLGDPAAEPLLADLTRHRRPTIRARSFDALVRTGAPRAAELAARGLGDGDGSVRAAATEALGSLGTKAATAPLFVALDRDVEGAARALGRVARPGDLDALIARLQAHPLERVAPMVEPLLARDDLGLSEKLRLVDALGKLGSDEARAELTRLQTALPRAAPPLKRALAQAAAGATP